VLVETVVVGIRVSKRDGLEEGLAAFLGGPNASPMHSLLAP